MKRYTIYVIPDRDMEAEECINGEWVRFEDYQQEVERLREALGEALEWNWLDDDAPQDVRERLEKLAGLQEPQSGDAGQQK